MRTSIVICLLVAIVTLAWFSPNIYGHYRFIHYCEREGGLKVSEKILPDQGWLAAGSDPYDYKAPFYLGKVAFVRYKDKTGARFDVYAKQNTWPRGPDYVLMPVDELKKVRYMLKYVNEFVPNELRLGKDQTIIFSIPEKKILVNNVNFSYAQFDQNKTLLSAPSGEYCPRLNLTSNELSNAIFKY